MKNFWQTAGVSLVISGLMLIGYHFLEGNGSRVFAEKTATTNVDNDFARQVSRRIPTEFSADGSEQPLDFHEAASIAMPTVVHIKSTRTISQTFYDPFYDFFGRAPSRTNSRQQLSSGSGVIVGNDGYIVTNNHVIKDADVLTVTLFDDRTFTATVIGTDPSTDLGLIKIDATDLPTVILGDSDDILVGEWVLAVGNPFSLASTVTAGIISAIGRDLEIIKDQMAIESFIQTDAAVNPGNSGGALVDLEGHLIGVNTAIASPTGAYAGYAFAVPANIVKKVVDDLRSYGTVQRAFLGVVSGDNLNADVANELQLDITEGVYVRELSDIGGAYEAGIREGDVIVEIEGKPIRNDSRLLEIVGRSRPGDRIDVKVYRDGRYRKFPVLLTNRNGNTDLIISNRNELLTQLGVDMRDLTDQEKSRLGIDRGVLVNKLYAGKMRQATNMQENFVILKFNGLEVEDATELIGALEGAKGEVTLVGFYPRYNRLYEYKINLDE